VSGLKVFGLPLDLGGNPGSSLGAGRLLRVFQQRFGRLRTGDCPGRWRYWSDHAEVAELAYTLESTFETWRTIVDREVRDALREGRFPAFFGGNHLAVGTAMSSVLDVIPDAVVVSLDAHFDLGPADRSTTAMDHSNFWPWLVRRPEDQVCWAGTRGDPPDGYDHVRHVSAARLRERGIEWAVEELDVLGRQVLLDIDLDVLDPSAFPALVSRTAGGPDWLEVSGLVRRLARVARVRAFGLSEYNALLDDGLDSCLTSASDLALQVLDAVLPEVPAGLERVGGRS